VIGGGRWKAERLTAISLASFGSGKRRSGKRLRRREYVKTRGAL